MKTIVCILLLLIAAPCAAEPGWGAQDKTWDAMYFLLGNISGTGLQTVGRQSYIQSVLETAFIAGCKEMFDGLYSVGAFGTPDSGHWLLDARGADAMDVVYCALGAASTIVYRVRGCTFTFKIQMGAGWQTY